MKDNNMEMVKELLGLITIDIEDELTKQVIVAYIFGLLNAKVSQDSGLDPMVIQAQMIRIGIEQLSYSEEASYQMTQFLIDATDPDFHPTVNAIIHRGIDAYQMYSEKRFEELAADLTDIINLVKG